jgi:hydroxylaminobenzene mutase
VFILIAVLLLALPHSVSARSTLVMVTAVCLTWLMTRSEVANAWWSTAAVLAIATKQAAGTTGRALWQEQLMKLTNIGAGIGLIVAWTLLIAGFARKPVSQN